MELNERVGPDWERELRDLWPRLLMFFHGRGFSEAQSMAQECIVRTWKKIDEGEEIANLRAYVFKVAKNVANETRRAAARKITGIPRGPDTKGGSEQRFKALEAAKKSVFTKRERKLFDLYHSDGMGKKRRENRKDLAGRLGLSRNALRIRMSRLLKRLRTELKGKTDGNTQES